MSRAEQTHSQLHTSFGIGNRAKVPAFVELDEVKAHLALLNVFKRVRDEIRYNAPVGEGDALALEKAREAHWRTYLQRAVARFDLYIARILNDDNAGAPGADGSHPPPANEYQLGDGGEDHTWAVPPPAYDSAVHLSLDLDEIIDASKRPGASARDVALERLPPVDVLLIWHSYLLQPAQVWEEAFREQDRAAILTYKFPLLEMATLVHDDQNRFDTPSASELWNTRIPHWPFHQCPTLDSQAAAEGPIGPGPAGIRLPCPHCPSLILVPWTMSSGRRWSAPCPDRNCLGRLNADLLRGQRLTADLQRWSVDPQFRLAGTTISGKDAKVFEYNVSDILFRPIFRCSPRELPELSFKPIPADPATQRDVGAVARKCSLSFRAMSEELEALVADALRTEYPAQEQRMPKDIINALQKQLRVILAQYAEWPGMQRSLIDLVGVCQRQFAFVDQIDALGWMAPDSLAADEHLDAIARGIVRYHRWLSLLWWKRVGLCPTLDIDLCWHTHMLKRSYVRNTVRYVGRLVDHVDVVDEQVLAATYERTEKVWASFYNEPYSTCGCSVEKPSLGARMFTALRNGSESESSPAVEGGFRARFKAAKYPSDETFEDATHPSTHPAVLVLENPVSALGGYHPALSWRKRRCAEAKEAEQSGKRRPGHPYAFGSLTHDAHGVEPPYPPYLDPRAECRRVDRPPGGPVDDEENPSIAALLAPKHRFAAATSSVMYAPDVGRTGGGGGGGGGLNMGVLAALSGAQGSFSIDRDGVFLTQPGAPLNMGVMSALAGVQGSVSVNREGVLLERGGVDAGLPFSVTGAVMGAQDAIHVGQDGVFVDPSGGAGGIGHDQATAAGGGC
ncbi:hypothetical protein OC835_006209 [Tilletia horrida]|nr:hypothetical protein OC835_006209 [Tilletia horrida]